MAVKLFWENVKAHSLSPAVLVTSWVAKGLKTCEILTDLSRIPTNNGTESRSGRTEIQHSMHENVHSNLVLVLLFVRTEVKYRKGLLLPNFKSMYHLITF